MGLLDFGSKIISTYKADVSDHVKGLQKLKGEEKARAQATIEANKQIEESLEGQIKTLGKLALGIGAAFAAGKVAIESYHFALEESRLEMGAQGVSIEGLRKASKGLKTDMDLLRDSVKFKSAAFKMSQQDMEDVEGAMRSFARRGLDVQKVNDAITQSLTKLSTEGLQELGINVQKAGLSMDDAADRGELFKRVMAALREESMGVANAELTKQERMAASGVAFENAVDGIKKSIGEMVVALAPLIKKFAEIIAMVPQVGQSIGTGVGKFLSKNVLGRDFEVEDYFARNNTVEENQAMSQRRAARLAELGRLAAGKGRGSDAYRRLANLSAGRGEDDDGIEIETDTAAPVGAGYKGKGERDKGARSTAAVRNVQQALAALSNALAADVVDVSTLGPKGGLGAAANDNSDIFGADVTNRFFQEESSRRYEAQADALAAKRERQSSFLESSFGPIEEFNQYAAAFNMLSGAVTSAMDAWITGSESMGTAIKKALGAGIKALASELAMQALRHGAYALGSLAFGDVRGAAAHGAAAAKFAAGAAVAAVVAREMGHGGTDYGKSASGGGAGAAAPRPTGSGSAPDPGSHVVYVVGDNFGDRTPRQRAKDFERQARRAVGDANGGPY